MLKLFYTALALAAANAIEISAHYKGADSANISDYETRGINALFELANLTTHVPESFIINKRSSKAVLD